VVSRRTAPLSPTSPITIQGVPFHSKVAMSSQSLACAFVTITSATVSPRRFRAVILAAAPLSLWVQKMPGLRRDAAIPLISLSDLSATRPKTDGSLNSLEGAGSCEQLVNRPLYTALRKMNKRERSTGLGIQ